MLPSTNSHHSLVIEKWSKGQESALGQFLDLLKGDYFVWKVLGLSGQQPLVSVVASLAVVKHPVEGVFFFIRTRQLRTNRWTHAVIRTRAWSSDTRCKMGISIKVTDKDISGWSLFSAGTGLQLNDGTHSDSGLCSQSGPFHHMGCSSNSTGYRPLEAQSAGLEEPATCHHR